MWIARERAQWIFAWMAEMLGPANLDVVDLPSRPCDYIEGELDFCRSDFVASIDVFIASIASYAKCRLHLCGVKK